MDLHTLQNSTRKTQTRRRVGRGIGSGLGKTSGRGQKGAGARSGYKRRLGYEGGQFRTHMKMPERGFSRARFSKRFDVINLDQISSLYEDGEVVSWETLMDKGFLGGTTYGLKILGKGTLTKKVTFQVESISEGAKKKLEEAGIHLEIV